MISFWPSMILVIRNGFAAMRGKKISNSVFDQLPIFLAHAEFRLDFALWREACRRLGWNPRAIAFELFPTPEDWADTARRFENYRRACMSLEACARGYVEHPRAQHGLTKAEPRRHAASTDARLHRAAHHELLVQLRLRHPEQRATRASVEGRARPRVRTRIAWRSSVLKIHRPTSHAPRARSHPDA